MNFEQVMTPHIWTCTTIPFSKYAYSCPIILKMDLCFTGHFGALYCLLLGETWKEGRGHFTGGKFNNIMHLMYNPCLSKTEVTGMTIIISYCQEHESLNTFSYHFFFHFVYCSHFVPCNVHILSWVIVCF